MKALKWPSLSSCRDEHILKLVRKCIHGRCPQYFKNYFVFNKDICARSTRQSNLLHLPAIRTEVAKRSFYYHRSMVLIVIVNVHLIFKDLVISSFVMLPCIYVYWPPFAYNLSGFCFVCFITREGLRS